MQKSTYESPLNTRYASKEMQALFSPDTRFRTWRLLWIALAEAEMELGLPITQEQIEELKEHQNDINYEYAEMMEKEVRHDVMAHVHAYGAQCPKAKGIIHLGATSCFVTDNADIIIYSKALKLIRTKVLNVIRKLSDFAYKYRDLPTLGYTHFQPAQLVTVGKRACLWIQDLLFDLEELDFVLEHLYLLGNKGTTGTQASFLKLFDGDHEKVKKLEQLIAEKVGFKRVIPVSGQTYTRKQDSRILNVLSAIAQSAYKFSNDLRLLQHLKEIEEPFEKNQIGSSAMAYKRNPMRSERISSLARYVIVNALNAPITASTQWLERTLDDSANRRISIPEAFLAVDAILNIYINIADGMVVYPKMIEKRVMEELPFMATENILMEAVKKGGDRQSLHERIRVHSMAAADRVKKEGLNNDLIERIAQDSAFGLDINELKDVLNPRNFIGRSVEQVEEFLKDCVKPVLDANPVEEIHVSLNV
ncbi:adenylosuccinate lyase PurB [Thermoclostridium stercorarium subsp. stercorarium DSM 8532]|uniref:Adenylosuccinate lyase n=2 Tax=Thermoclostridium stercorarium TaxID=1510 RepID=L7VRU7_THES1|nr:adenylosuccinate lyase [Thermoclostridium stercorarium]AGC68293.1 adenylosuccinate lyase PurB [Thermoclostridium stercorarium subsp. stercorarium DSM 8532]AGI39321.1 adenylosuccinate lyase [Thermoclostridium stercorarium subsp. stercorarium DSM 8532]UZQ86803.1 adenylosuccinate lyase [Thermoclostridium stercorarium]